MPCLLFLPTPAVVQHPNHQGWRAKCSPFLGVLEDAEPSLDLSGALDQGSQARLGKKGGVTVTGLSSEHPNVLAAACCRAHWGTGLGEHSDDWMQTERSQNMPPQNMPKYVSLAYGLFSAKDL